VQGCDVLAEKHIHSTKRRLEVLQMKVTDWLQPELIRYRRIY
jgi:hypothetical protein